MGSPSTDDQGSRAKKPHVSSCRWACGHATCRIIPRVPRRFIAACGVLLWPCASGEVDASESGLLLACEDVYIADDVDFRLRLQGCKTLIFDIFVWTYYGNLWHTFVFAFLPQGPDAFAAGLIEILWFQLWDEPR